MNIKRDLTAIMLNEGDELVDVKLTMGDKDCIAYTLGGKAVRISTKDVSETNRISKGVKAMDLDRGDSCLGLDVINKSSEYILVVTSKGRAKRCRLSDFNTMKRNMSPLVLSTLSAGEYIRFVKPVSKSNKYVRINSTMENMEIPIEDIQILTRLAQPKKIINVGNGGQIVYINVK